MQVSAFQRQTKFYDWWLNFLVKNIKTVSFTGDPRCLRMLHRSNSYRKTTWRTCAGGLYMHIHGSHPTVRGVHLRGILCTMLKVDRANIYWPQDVWGQCLHRKCSLHFDLMLCCIHHDSCIDETCLLRSVTIYNDLIHKLWDWQLLTNLYVPR